MPFSSARAAESNANLEKAATLDPKNTDILMNLCFSYMAQRDFEVADKTVDRLIATSPQSFQARIEGIHRAPMERRS